MDNPRTTIGFTYENEFGNYSASSSLFIDPEVGNEIDEIGRQLNVFLNQIGFIRPNGHIFMADVTEDEAIALDSYLEEYRSMKDTEE